VREEEEAMVPLEDLSSTSNSGSTTTWTFPFPSSSISPSSPTDHGDFSYSNPYLDNSSDKLSRFRNGTDDSSLLLLDEKLEEEERKAGEEVELDELGDALCSRQRCRLLFRSFLTKEFWRKEWWVVLGYLPLSFLLLLLAVLLIWVLVFFTAKSSKSFLFLFFLLGALFLQLPANAIYFAFKENRNSSKRNLKRRGLCIILEVSVLLLLVQCILFFMIPNAVLFSSWNWNELAVGDTLYNTNIKSPTGLAWLEKANCNITVNLAIAQRFFGCSLDVSKVSFYFGGQPILFPKLGFAGVTIFRNVYLKDPIEYCPTPGLLVHELFHVFQTEHGLYSLEVYLRELYLQFKLRWAMYKYGGLEGVKKDYNAGFPFSDYNPEQQASMAADYFNYLRANSTDPDLVYMSKYLDPLLTDCINMS